jgi:hypothetical protein
VLTRLSIASARDHHQQAADLRQHRQQRQPKHLEVFARWPQQAARRLGCEPDLDLRGAAANNRRSNARPDHLFERFILDDGPHAGVGKPG